MDSVSSKGKFSPGRGPVDTNEPLPQISVVVPVYKAEKYLRECVESVLGQTFKNFELILVDDGSPDRCGEICDELAGKDPRIRVFHQENGGVTSARRLGVEKARAEWICFVDSDDLLPKAALKNLFDEATDDTDWVQGMRQDFENEKIPEAKPRTGQVTSFDLIGLVENMLFYHPYLWGKLIRKNLFSPHVFEIPREITVGEDTQINFRLIVNLPRKSKEVSKVVYFYRHYENIASHFHPLTEDYILRIYELFLVEIEKLPVANRKRARCAVSRRLHNNEICDMLKLGMPIKFPPKLAPIVRPIAWERFRYFFNYVCLVLGCPKIAQARIKISAFMHRRKRSRKEQTFL